MKQSRRSIKPSASCQYGMYASCGCCARNANRVSFICKKDMRKRLTCNWIALTYDWWLSSHCGKNAKKAERTIRQSVIRGNGTTTWLISTRMCGSSNAGWRYIARRATVDTVIERSPLPAGQWHEVQDGENLRMISRQYFGTNRNWRTLQMVNDVSMYPRPGTKVWISSGDLSTLEVTQDDQHLALSK